MNFAPDEKSREEMTKNGFCQRFRIDYNSDIIGKYMTDDDQWKKILKDDVPHLYKKFISKDGKCYATTIISVENSDPDVIFIKTTPMETTSIFEFGDNHFYPYSLTNDWIQKNLDEFFELENERKARDIVENLEFYYTIGDLFDMDIPDELIFAIQDFIRGHTSSLNLEEVKKEIEKLTARKSESENENESES